MPFHHPKNESRMKKLRYANWLVMVFCVFSSSLWGQRTVQGLVKDAQSGNPLAFAHVVVLPQQLGTITNEEGRFSIAVPESAAELYVSFLGYEPQRLALGQSVELTVALQPQTNRLAEVVVRSISQEELYRHFFQSTKTTRKAQPPALTQKVFRRSYAVDQQQDPTEFLEAYYNLETAYGRFRNIGLKNGRVSIPDGAYYLNLDLNAFLLNLSFFDVTQYPFGTPTPFQVTNLRRLKKQFDLDLIDQQLDGTDTLLTVQFTPIDPAGFSGTAVLRYPTPKVEEFSLQIQLTDQHPFETVVDPANNRIQSVALTFDIGLVDHKAYQVFKYWNVQADFFIQTSAGPHQLTSQSRYVFYDYGRPFILPLLGTEYTLNDYETIFTFPYHPEFWERHQLLPLTEEETAIKSKLQAVHTLGNQDGWKQLNGVNRKLEHWRPYWVPTKDKTTKWGNAEAFQFEVGSGAQMMIEAPNLRFQPSFFVDVDTYPDTTIVRAYALCDYQGSHLEHFNELSQRHFGLSLEYVHLELQQILPDLQTIAGQSDRLYDQMVEFQNRMEKELYLTDWKARNESFESAAEELRQRIEALR
jgi:hypothetical protein